MGKLKDKSSNSSTTTKRRAGKQGSAGTGKPSSEAGSSRQLTQEEQDTIEAALEMGWENASKLMDKPDDLVQLEKLKKDSIDPAYPDLSRELTTIEKAWLVQFRDQVKLIIDAKEPNRDVLVSKEVDAMLHITNDFYTDSGLKRPKPHFYKRELGNYSAWMVREGIRKWREDTNNDKLYRDPPRTREIAQYVADVKAKLSGQIISVNRMLAGKHKPDISTEERARVGKRLEALRDEFAEKLAEEKLTEAGNKAYASGARGFTAKEIAEANLTAARLRNQKKQAEGENNDLGD